jgi:hypothetical protein
VGWVLLTWRSKIFVFLSKWIVNLFNTEVT